MPITLKQMEATILQELDISSDLEDEFTKQSGFFAYWAFKNARAMDRVRQLEERQELVFSQLYAKFRADNPKESKENDCKAYVRRHRLYKKVSSELRIAKRSADTFKVAVRAFEMRQGMLMQLGAQDRAEWHSTDPSLKARTKKANAIVRKAAKTRRRRRED